jgi:hypothetical protein
MNLAETIVVCVSFPLTAGLLWWVILLAEKKITPVQIDRKNRNKRRMKKQRWLDISCMHMKINAEELYLRHYRRAVLQRK